MTQDVRDIRGTDLARHYLVDKAKENLLTYTDLTYPKYRPNWHHRVIARHLEDAAEGRIKRLMILVPPRYGKSELSSIRLPAWYLGKYPDKKVILASYSDWFSLQFGKHARNVCQTEMHRTIFPESKVRKDSSSGALWELDAGGKFVAVGRGGAVTGHGAHLLILDDLIKNIQEAFSDNMRDTIWDWYKTTLFTRLEQDASIVIVNTRWHEDDLIGRILEHEGEKWTVLKMPAIADKDYTYGEYVYNEGETLWPEKYPLETVLETKGVMGSHFDSIYQQEPGAQSGTIFKRDQWRKFFTPPHNPKWVIQSWDTGFKTGSQNSYSACTTWVETDSGFYLIHAWWDRLTFPELKSACVDLYDKFKPNEVIIEDKASGQSLIQELKQNTKVPVKGIKPEGDKSARAHSVTPLFESGSVYILEGEQWSDEVIDYAAKFPRTKNTDVIDSVTQALEYLRQGSHFKYSYHGGSYTRGSTKKSIFELEREKRNAGR